MCTEQSEPAPSSKSADEEWEEWFRAVEEFLDETVEREGKLECVFDDLQLDIPTSWGEDTEHTQWRFDGIVRIKAEGNRRPLAAWLEWWYDRRSSSKSSK